MSVCRGFLFLALLAPLSGLTPTPSSAPRTPVATPAEAEAALWATRFLTRFHYRRVALDDAMSARILDRFIKALDADRMVFLASDIEEFQIYRDHLDDAIFEGELSPPFHIFSRCLTRTQERVAHARQLLKSPPDFTIDERYHFNREKAPWSGSGDELDEVWRQRVKNDWLRLKLAGKTPTEIVATLDKRYRRFSEQLGQVDGESVFQTFMNAYTQEIEPHTGYFAPRSSENFNIQMRLSLEGIGAILQREDDHTVIREIIAGGPAAQEGTLQVGDKIVAVGQNTSSPAVDVVGWNIEEVVALIRGKRGSSVYLDVVPARAGTDGKPIRLALVRDEVKLEDQAAKGRLIESGTEARIGIITLPTFYHDFEAERRGEADHRSSARDVKTLIQDLRRQGMEGLVIDLRGNGGGSMTEAVLLAGLFIDKGPVVQVRDIHGTVTREEDHDGHITWDGPLAVLIDRESASASEIFAAAMQDLGRAIIVGERSYGKGTVQNLVDLDLMAQNNAGTYGQLKMTVAQFFRITGGSTQLKGVTPDVSFPQTWDPKDLGESALPNALPWTTVPRAPFFQANAVLGTLVPRLEVLHRARVAQDPEFRWWVADLALYHGQRQIREVSLVESVRQAERNRDKARLHTRQAERSQAGLKEGPVQPDSGLLDDEAAPAAPQSGPESSPTYFLAIEAARILADAMAMLPTPTTKRIETPTDPATAQKAADREGKEAGRSRSTGAKSQTASVGPSRDATTISPGVWGGRA